MASQLVLVLWTDHPADVSLASDLAQLCAAQVFRSTSQSAAVVSATSTPLEVHDITAAVDAFAAQDAPEPATPVEPAAPVVISEPQPTYPDGTPIPTPGAVDVRPPEDATLDTTPPAVDPSTTAASAGLVSSPVPDPASPLVDSDEHMAVLVHLFEGLSPEQKAKLDEEVHTMEDAHAALEAIYAPLAALETPTTDTQAPSAP